MAVMKKMAQQVISSANNSESIQLLDETDTYSILGTDKGFAVISKNDEYTAVLGYSETPYHKDNLPCGLQWWLSAVNVSLAKGSHRSISEQGVTAETFQPEVVNQLMTTQWGQGDPYNYLCPKVNSQNAPTGCVATAMAQILNYYDYPERSSGIGYYTMGSSDYRQYVEINSTYDWKNLRDSYKGVASIFLSDDEKKAIGQLMFDAGAASHMNYNSSGSGTTGYIAGNAFAQVFQFDSLSLKCVDRDYCESDVVWKNTILNELKAGRPILMCGVDDLAGGHAFIIDGMDAEGKVHVNWGWDGDGDGYYSLLDLNPSGILGQSSTMHFNRSQSIVTNLRCDPVPQEGAVYKSCWVISAEDNLRNDELNGLILSAPDATLWQHNHLVFYGKVGLVFLDNDEQEALFHTFFDTSDKANGWSPIEGGHGYSASYFSRISTSDLASLPAGTYKAFLASKAIQEKTPQYICYPGGKHKEYMVTKATDGSLTVETVDPTAIRTLSLSSDVVARYYNLQGREVGSDTRGLVIMKQGNTVRKVVR